MRGVDAGGGAASDSGNFGGVCSIHKSGGNRNFNTPCRGFTEWGTFGKKNRELRTHGRVDKIGSCFTNFQEEEYGSKQRKSQASC